MKPYPHVYTVSAEASATGMVSVTSPGLPRLDTAPPPEFDGPEGHWSPETLFMAAIADCFILTFRGVSCAARFDWISLQGGKFAARCASARDPSARSGRLTGSKTDLRCINR